MDNLTRKEIWALVDRITGNDPDAFCEFLLALSESAYTTAQHLQSNWQDDKSANQWDTIGNVIGNAMNKVSKLLPY